MLQEVQLAKEKKCNDRKYCESLITMASNLIAMAPGAPRVLANVFDPLNPSQTPSQKVLGAKGSWELCHKFFDPQTISSSPGLHPLLLLRLLLQTSTASAGWQCSRLDLNRPPPDLNRELRLAVFPARPQLRGSRGSVPRRTSTASFGWQCSPPDLNPEEDEDGS